MADMVKNINIVPFSDEYASAVEALVIEAWTPIRESYRRELGEELYGRVFGDWKRDKTESVLSMMSSGRGYVAVVDGELAGFIHYEISEDGVSGEIGNNAVSSRFRGRMNADNVTERKQLVKLHLLRAYLGYLFLC